MVRILTVLYEFAHIIYAYHKIDQYKDINGILKCSLSTFFKYLLFSINYYQNSSFTFISELSISLQKLARYCITI